MECLLQLNVEHFIFDADPIVFLQILLYQSSFTDGIFTPFAEPLPFDRFLTNLRVQNFRSLQ
jgi:hypothetical protein